MDAKASTAEPLPSLTATATDGADLCAARHRQSPTRKMCMNQMPSSPLDTERRPLPSSLASSQHPTFVCLISRPRTLRRREGPSRTAFELATGGLESCGSAVSVGGGTESLSRLSGGVAADLDAHDLESRSAAPTPRRGRAPMASRLRVLVPDSRSTA